MILESLTLNNFRQYYGTQRIFFSKDKAKNITVIHGENGAGKTALLNSFSWCLYGKSDLPDPDDVISERAIAEARVGDEVEAYVRLEFNDDSRRYFATRRVRARMNGSGEAEYFQPILELEYIDETGKTVIPRNAQDTIDQIIPADLGSYFFFDGERIDNLTKKEGVKDIKKAIKILMGLEILERGTTHLDDVKKIFRDETAEYGNLQAQQVVAEMKTLEDQIADKRGELELARKNKEAIGEAIGAVQERLRTLDASQELQAKKDGLLAQEGQIKTRLGETRKALQTTASKRGYLAFCADVISMTKAALEDKREKLQLPSPVRKQFLNDLLTEQVCICGTTLTPGSKAHEHVVKLRQEASTKELEDAFIEMSGDVKVLEEKWPELFQELTRLQTDKQAQRQSLKSTQEELSEVSSLMEGKDVEGVATLARRERELETERSEADQEIGRIIGQIQALEQAAQEKRKAYEALQVQSEKARLAKRRMEACERVGETILAILELQSDEVQRRLQRKISEVHSKMLRKGYEAVIDENYLLAVNKVVGDQKIPVRMSQGERQVTSLSFIGAIVDIAREQYEKEPSVYFRGGYYPVVMDSPFGSMDDDHRQRTAVSIPTLTHQVVVLASSSQWKGPVEKGMSPAIGREYHLNYKSPKQDPSIQYEHTAIEEAKNA